MVPQESIEEANLDVYRMIRRMWGEPHAEAGPD
jgi:hypothetical protein